MKCFKQLEQNNRCVFIGDPTQPVLPQQIWEGQKIKEALILYIIYIMECIWILFFYASIILLSLIYFCAWGQEPTPFPSQPQQEEMGLFWRKNSLYSVFYILLKWDTLYYIYPVYLCFLLGGGGLSSSTYGFDHSKNILCNIFHYIIFI